MKVWIMLVMAVFASMPAASAQDGSPACRAGQTDRRERPAPNGLLPALGRTFGVAPDALRNGSFTRCDRGRLLACEVGANLNCGRANRSRHSVGADAFCRQNPDAEVVPMVATGHDTIFAWRCRGGRARAGRTVAAVDRLGFMVDNWRPVR